LYGEACFKAVQNREQAVGEALKGKLARFGDFFVRTAAGVLHLGLAANKLVLQVSNFGLKNRNLSKGR
jgi:hypothetical protein